MSEINTCIPEASPSKTPALSPAEIRNLSVSEKNPQGVVFPDFENYSQFKASSFFKKYYDLGEKVILFNQESHLLQSFSLDESARFVENLQRILVILGYLQISDFSGDYCDIYPETQDCSDTSVWRYFGVFGKKTQDAVQSLQVDYAIKSGKKVGDQTKEVIYQKVFQLFHSSEQKKCREKTINNISQLKNNNIQ